MHTKLNKISLIQKCNTCNLNAYVIRFVSERKMMHRLCCVRLEYAIRMIQRNRI
jgi:hypothetical protein